MPDPQHVQPDTRNLKPNTSRPFFLDFIAAVALLVVGFLGARGLARTLGVIPALFFFVVVAGLGWYYFRTAWRALRRGREGKP